MTLDDLVLLVLAAMSPWGGHRLVTLLEALRSARPRHEAASSSTGDLEPRSAPLPFVVTVQVPLYNEVHVAARVIDAACGLRHACVRGFEVQVLDDSTDGTTDIVADAVQRWRARGIDVVHLRRPDRAGFKAGALAHGLARARGDLIAIFDADFVPAPDFLERIVPRFSRGTGGPDLVQARWGHLNRDTSWLTRAQAALLDVHFDIEQRGRAASGRFFGFNGTAGVWRRSAIERAGGWGSETLTEDLELSIRAWLAGGRFEFAHDVEVPAELPSNMRALRIQQRRWARGGVEAARLRLRDVWRARRSLVDKVDVTLKLTQNLLYPLLFLLVALLPFAAVSAEASAIAARATGVLGALVGIGPVGVGLAWSARRSGASPVRAGLDAIMAVALAAALSASCGWAVLVGVLRRGTPTFERTPKHGGLPAAPEGATRGERAPWVELALGGLHTGAAATLMLRGQVSSTLFLWLCGAACLATAVESMRWRVPLWGARAPLGVVEQQPGGERGNDGDARPRSLLPHPLAREPEDGLVEQG